MAKGARSVISGSGKAWRVKNFKGTYPSKKKAMAGLAAYHVKENKKNGR